MEVGFVSLQRRLVQGNAFKNHYFLLAELMWSINKNLKHIPGLEV